jgi:hypothetical protein
MPKNSKDTAMPKSNARDRQADIPVDPTECFCFDDPADECHEWHCVVIREADDE